MEKRIGVQELVTMLELPGMGRETAQELLGSLDHKVSGKEDLIDFIREKAAEHRLPSYADGHFDRAFGEAGLILAQSEKLDIKVISFLDERYPPQLLDKGDFPVTLNYKGDIGVLVRKPNIALIGTREPSEFGRKAGERLGEFFASLQFNVVSGLAKGCDTAAHVGALKGKGTTTAVLAHGLDWVYPRENAALAEEIVGKGGLLVSEYFVRQKPLSHYFVERDRIQAGLSQGVMIVETDVVGGTMHTARFCLEYGRRLACLNHPEEYRDHPKARGNQLLIREGKAMGVYEKAEINYLSSLLLDEFHAGKKIESVHKGKTLGRSR